ncbi:hypothetical protein M1L60_41125 [Actinoplanes sp. TRM 88003]|uniref:Uncharacterized protein n=1 Tax=Paractinoplanes aksuensis TaxID=2939490 RepID=A0ABT1E4D0_9ACTN|nr:hypothetical protein [Actinoplanes aksuensis]MCO8277000.1 hypothetical protein [Actinoplanes aksuensis]
MQLAQVLDVIERVLVAAEHPDIVKIERYGTGTEPWGPSAAKSRTTSIAGVRVTYASTATAMLWGAIWPGEKPLPMPAELPKISDRVARLSILVVQLLDVAKPAAFTSWQLVSLPDLGPQDAPAPAPAGVSVVCADGTKMLLRAASTGATVGDEPENDPTPDYVIPAGVSGAGV